MAPTSATQRRRALISAPTTDDAIPNHAMSASDADRAARLAELDARRKRLEEMKKRKAGAGSVGGSIPSTTGDDLLREVNGLLGMPFSSEFNLANALCSNCDDTMSGILSVYITQVMVVIRLLFVHVSQAPIVLRRHLTPLPMSRSLLAPVHRWRRLPSPHHRRVVCPLGKGFLKALLLCVLSPSHLCSCPVNVGAEIGCINYQCKCLIPMTSPLGYF
jgi:hypothetical protein